MKSIDTLAGLLVDFMDLSEAQELPALTEVKVTVNRSGEPPAIEAQLEQDYPLAAGPVWQAMAAWAAAVGSEVEAAPSFDAGDRKPFRSISVRACYAGHPVRIWAHVPGDAQVPEGVRETTKAGAR